MGCGGTKSVSMAMAKAVLVLAIDDLTFQWHG